MNYFDYEYRVRYGDTDKLGISYYANYLVWFEAARTEYFRALGLPYTECEKQGYFLPVVEAGIKYRGTSTYDDLLIVRTSVADVGGTSIRFEYQVFPKVTVTSSGDSHLLKGQTPKILTTGFTVHVFVDKTFKPVRIPEIVSRIVTPFKLL